MERYEERVDKANNKQQKQDIPILTVIITTTSNTTITTTVRGKATSNSTDNSCTKAKRLPQKNATCCRSDHHYPDLA